MVPEGPRKDSSWKDLHRTFVFVPNPEPTEVTQGSTGTGPTTACGGCSYKVCPGSLTV